MRSGAQTIMDAASSVVSYIKPIYYFFSKSTKPHVKTHRARTAFSTNVTASLTLPEIIETCEEEKIENKEIPSSTFSISTYLWSLNPLAKSVLPSPAESKQECKKIAKHEPVRKKMKLLQNSLKDLKDPTEYDKITCKKLMLVEEIVKEHAGRRVDLFFYLLLAVRDRHVLIVKDHTVKQHGVGSKKTDTQACHSSLFPNVKFTAPSSVWNWIWPAHVELKDSAFEDSLNMTTELPSIVNEFDCRLEGQYKPSKTVLASLALLNRVSKNEIDIKTAMNEFFVVMQQFFSFFENKYFIKGKKFTQAGKKVWELQKEGTFKGANKDMTISDKYLHLMLRLTPNEIIKAKKNPVLLTTYYKRIQDEILMPKSHALEKKR